MAKINDTTTYPNTAPALTDHVPGTDVSNTANDANGESVTFTMQAIMDLFEANFAAPADFIDAITEISASLKTGADTTLVTGTAGTTDQIATWNADGDLVGTSAGVISSLTEKATPASGDWLVLSDSAASGALKKVDWSKVQPYDANLPTWPATVDATEVGYLNGVTSAIQTQIDTKAATTLSVNAQTGTTYTLVLGDAGKKVTMSNASANTLTIPTNASVAFPTGTIIGVSMLGAGATTVDGDTGVTVNGVSGGGAAISAQYTGVTLTKIGTDTWLMEGNHGAVA